MILSYLIVESLNKKMLMYDIQSINCGFIHILWGCHQHGYWFVVTHLHTCQWWWHCRRCIFTSPKNKIIVGWIVDSRGTYNESCAGPVLDSNKSALILLIAIYKFIWVIVQVRVRLNALQAKPFFVKNSRKWIMM